MLGRRDKAGFLTAILVLVFLWSFFAFGWNAEAAAQSKKTEAKFDSKKDILSLHYDHAPDKDDGHSAAADRTILQTQFGTDWIKKHVVAVSGAYGKNAKRFNSKSNAVMNATWQENGGWIAAHRNHDKAVSELAERWSNCLKNEGDVWVKEGGQSDITAKVVRLIRKRLPEIDTKKRIHVIQHSKWNENETTEKELEYTKQKTDYVKIADANQFLNIKGGDEKFVKAALANKQFGKAWKAAFDYYDPKVRLDFSDTGELMHILDLGKIDIDAFRKNYLANKK